MITTICKNEYERNITLVNQFNLETKDIEQLITNPKISNTKNSTVYFYPFDMDYSNNTSYADMSNAKNLTAIVIDSDNGYSIDKFIAEWHEYEFYLYTTFSHSEEKPKWRAIFPLNTVLPFDIYRKSYFKEWLLSVFPANDPATIKFQGFYMPNTSNITNYVSYIGSGKLFDIKDHMNEIKKIKTKHSIYESFDKAFIKYMSKFNSNKTSASVINNSVIREYLDSPICSTGYGNISFRCICIALKAGDNLTLEQIKDKMLSDSFTYKEIDRAILQASNY